MSQTIFAQITPPGYSSTAIVRVSGDKCKDIIQQLCDNAKKIISEPRVLVLSKINFANDIVDIALVSYFPAPYSFTGDDSIEFNIHGSPLIIKKLMSALKVLDCRLAEPGEFSKRAFLNGKMDLTQAEAVADLIASETEAQAKVALTQLSGKLKDAINEIGEPLHDVLAELEAFIDFPEEDIPPISISKWQNILSDVIAKIQKYLDSYQTGKIYKDGASVVLVGAPNVGKSTLLNTLLGEDRAIVTEIPGTTRDTIEDFFSINGLYVRLTDTAGLVDAEYDINSEEKNVRIVDEVEKLGIKRSWQKIKEADLVLYLKNYQTIDDIESSESYIYDKVKSLAKKMMVVRTKRDLLADSGNNKNHLLVTETQDTVIISAKTGFGIKELYEKIYATLLSADTQSHVYITTKRHYDALELAKNALSNGIGLMRTSAQKSSGNTLQLDLISIELRDALRALEDIIGVTTNEDLLGRIFSKFCIGK